MFNPSSNTAQFCLADTALSSHSSLTPSLWRGQVFQNAWRGQVFQRLEEREKEKNFSRGEKFFKVFLFFLAWTKWQVEKKLVRLRKVYSLPGIQRSRLEKVVLLETRVCISSWEREATTTSMANSYRKMSFQQNCCRITACQKKNQLQKCFFPMSLAMETVSEHPPHLTVFS